MDTIDWLIKHLVINCFIFIFQHASLVQVRTVSGCIMWSRLRKSYIKVGRVLPATYSPWTVVNTCTVKPTWNDWLGSFLSRIWNLQIAKGISEYEKTSAGSITFLERPLSPGPKNSICIGSNTYRRPLWKAHLLEKTSFSSPLKGDISRQASL